MYCPQFQEISSAICHAPALWGWLLAPFPFFKIGSAFHPSPAISGRLYSLSVSFSFVGGGFQSAHKLCWIMFLWEACGTWCSPVGFADLHKQLWNQASGQKWWVDFPKADALWDWVQAITGFSSVWSSVFFFLKKKKKGETARGFSQGRHTLVAVPCQDFPGC
jgi:hypothetical protein